MKQIEELLKGEIIGELEAMGDVQMGTEEYESSVNGLVKLIDRAIEMRKFDVETYNNASDREFDNTIKAQQLEDNEKDDKFKRVLSTCDSVAKNTISLLGIILPLYVTVWGTKTSLKFEETGAVTTIMGRGFINKLIPKK